MQENIFKTTEKYRSDFKIIPLCENNRQLAHNAKVALTCVFITRTKNKVGRADGFPKMFCLIYINVFPQ